MKRIAPFVLIAFAAIALAGTVVWDRTYGGAEWDEALPVVWDRTYGGAEDDVAYSIVALADGGFAVAGYTKSKGNGGRDMWVLRLDEAGNVVWDKTFGGAWGDVASSIVALSDGGFAVAGKTDSKIDSNQRVADMRVLRLDEAGNVDF